MADQKMKEYHKEYSKKYQQTEKFKEQKRQYYLEKVRKEYMSKTVSFLVQFQVLTKKNVKNETEILKMVDDAEDTAKLKEIYDRLLFIIKLK